MKNIAAFLCLAFAASLAHAQPSPATKPVSGKAAPVKAAEAKATEAKAEEAKTEPAKKEVKKEAPLPKIPGQVINRPNGTFLSLQVSGGNFVLSFYDKKHKLMAVDVTRAIARWPNPRSPGDNRTVLNGSGTALVGSKPVLPPYNFNVYLTLLKGEGEEAKAVENYTVAYRG